MTLAAAAPKQGEASRTYRKNILEMISGFADFKHVPSKVAVRACRVEQWIWWAALLGMLGLHDASAAQPSIVDRWTVFAGTGQKKDWNEGIAGEVCNILHDPLDMERPYKTAVGGYNGPYGLRQKGKTRFAYSKDLKKWVWANGESPSIDAYTEDGCLIRHNGVYYYYCEPMPNRNILLYTSTDFLRWESRGIVVGPDIESKPELREGRLSDVAVGSPSAIVRNGRVYLFMESGATANPFHTNKLAVSDDGVNFPPLADTPDLFNRLSPNPILDTQVWTANNLEGLCEHNGRYFAWLSITNKTIKPTVFSMWEMVSDDLLNWSFTGANLTQPPGNAGIEGDYISFACLDYKTVVNGRLAANRAVEILRLDRSRASAGPLIKVPPIPASASYLKKISELPVVPRVDSR